MKTNMGIIVDAKNNASKTLKQVAQDVAGVDKAAAAAASGGLGGLTSMFAKGLGVAGLVAGAAAASKAIWDLGAAANGVAALRSSFEGLAESAGQSSDKMLDALRKASKGTIAESDLMLAANKSMMLGVADTADEMAALLKVAASRGKAMGLSTTQAFNDIITGLGRESALILDNLGIVVDLEKAHKDYAAELGKTAAQLTDVERKQALVNQVMKQSEGMAEAPASSMERMNASIQNAKQALGELFGPAVAVVAEQIAKAAEEATEAVRSLGEAAAMTTTDYNVANAEIQRLNQTLALLGEQYRQTGDAQIAAEIQALNVAKAHQQAAARAAFATSEMGALASAFGTLTDATRPSEEAIAATNAAMLDAGDSVRALTPELYAAADGMGYMGSLALSAGADLDTLSGAADALSARLGAVLGAIGNVRSAAVSKLESLALQAVEAGADPAQVAAEYGEAVNAVEGLALSYDVTTEAQFANKVALAQLTGELGANWQATVDAERAAQKAATTTGRQTKAVDQLSAAYSNLKSKVQSALQSALQGAGVDPTSILKDPKNPDAGTLLPREDDVAENARRLADIAVNGIKPTEWLEEFKAEVPQIWKEISESSDPRTAAAKMLQEFQQGFRPELLDKDLLKNTIKQQLLGESAMADLGDQIAQELAAELGISMQKAQEAVAGVTGVAPASAPADLLGDMPTLKAPTVSAEEAATTGSTFAAGFLVGFNGADVVTGITQHFALQIARFQSAGQTAGQTWGIAFLAAVTTNVPAPLISLLTNLVTPQVMAQLAAQQSMTGAQ